MDKMDRSIALFSSTKTKLLMKLKPVQSTSDRQGAWTPEKGSKLADVIAAHGAKRWKSIASKAGLNRCGRSCRLRWLNYLRPNIERGNISIEQEDLILRLHKLLGNRWSLIAARLPYRTDNEIKNYWNSHLIKKMKQEERKSGNSAREFSKSLEKKEVEEIHQEHLVEKKSTGVAENPTWKKVRVEPLRRTSL
ncbi:hypothetical protein L6164_021393 [Bauhinia variegata]|uniref:Uncharacterized protein n=1 Tax=Bauhinia variegata TaxID=167791 RepID=A0ACB9MYC4_BAUVA|nr:hypothetical protein L6164_021393 [Bauhinia variegata]